MVFSDIFGKSSQSIIDIILNNDDFSDDDNAKIANPLMKILFLLLMEYN